jgi:hypothetical protein
MENVHTAPETEAKVRKPKEAYAAADAASLRQTESAFRLLLRALGGPAQIYGKLARIGRTLLILTNGKELRRRLKRLQDLGFIETMPTAGQFFAGGLDMVRYFITPGAKDYYQSRGINFTFHQVLRLLDDPVSMIDPLGILSDRDTIIGHVLQVVHANPVYDLQVLDMFEDGLDEIERQTAAMLDGTHPRAQTIGAIVEDPEYHARLLDYIRRYRQDPFTPELRRRADQVRNNPDFVLAEETFGAMPSAMRYMARLPKGRAALLRHLLRQNRIAPAYCDPDTVEAVNREFATAS